MNFQIFLCWVLSLGMVSVGVGAADCGLTAAQQTPQPSWVTQSAPDDTGAGGGRYDGVGSSLITGGDLARATTEARSRANAELAQSIRVHISSAVKTSESKLTENGQTAVRSSIEAVTDSVADLQLQSVAVQGQWVDPAACRLWLRVSVPAAEALRAQRQALATGLVATFDVQIKQAGQEAMPVPERERALGVAAELLALIDPAQVSTFSAPVARMQIDALRLAVTDARRRFDLYALQLARHLQANSQLTTATATGQRRVAAAHALSTLQTLLGIATAMPGLPLPFEVKDRMAQLFGESGTPCLAKQWLNDHGLPPPAVQVAAACSATALAQERRQLYWAGQTVAVHCAITLGGQTQPWDKACAGIQDHLVRQGVTIADARTSPTAVVHQLTLAATGTIQQRQDPDTQARLWRFEGTITSSLTGPGQINIQDRYEGLTGWNPVSAAMTTDILALNAVKRFDAAITQHWEK